MKYKKVLVTGGAGAIGSNLVNTLLDKAENIIILDNLDSGYKDLLPNSPKIKFIKESILNDDVLTNIFKQKIDVVFHLAAHFANQNSVDHPEQDLLVNGLGTLKLLRYSKKYNVEKFIYASSSCVYGNVENIVSEELKEYKLDTPYAITKLLGEYYTKFFHNYHGLKTVILRIFNSFGPGEKPGKYRNVIPNFFIKAIKNESLIITGTGKETRDFNWIKNTVNAILLAAEKNGAVGQTFNVASGKSITILELANLINEITGNAAPLIFKERRDWDHIVHRKADISKTKRILGYRPEINLKKHLKETYEWIKRLR